MSKPQTMANVLFRGIGKIYEGDVTAVDNFNLEIADKEFVVFVGPSGCGKSTTLRMVAGLEEISSGELYIGDNLVNDVAPKDRDIAMVFQNYALYPHMTVFENMSFALRLRKIPKAEIKKKVEQAAEILDIPELLDRKPKQLSGGQRQRVAIGRAIVREPQVFLMDEPLSNLDAKLRNEMRTELIKLRKRIDTTFIYVTHDQTEAMTLGDRIVVMKDGHIQQVGTPQEIFDNPANVFVAGFIGTPKMNFFEADLIETSGKFTINLYGKDFELTEASQAALRKNGASAQKVILGIRPEHIQLNDSGISATVDVHEMMGSSMHLHLNVQDKDMVVIVPTLGLKTDISFGRELHLSFGSESIHLFDKETGVSLLA